MNDIRLSRRQVLKGAGAVGVLGALGIPTTVFADDEEVELLRWDLIQVVQGLVLTGGQDMATDAASKDVLTLTGSGEAAPKRRMATGGGTYVHTHADGTVFSRGVYRVTGFKSWKAAGGSLVGSGLADGIGTLAQTAGGLLVMNIVATAAPLFGGGSLPAVLGVDCAAPGVRFPITEGVHVDVLQFHFKQSGGFNIFHVLQGERQD
jgi:hypothetical protein